MRKLKILFVVLVGLIALYTLAGFVIIPMTAKSMLPKKLSAALKRPVTVQNIRINPYVLSLAVYGFDIKDKNGSDPFVSFDRLFINIDGASLFKMGVVIENISLEKPSVNVARLSSKEFNFSDLTAGGKTDEAKPAQEKAPLPIQFAISNIKIIDGKMTFHDNLKNKTYVFSPVNFTLPFISNFQPYLNTFAEPRLEGTLNGTNVSVKLETKPFTDKIETIVNVDLKGISVPDYFAYAPENLGFQVTKGALDIQSHLSFMREAKQSLLKINGTADLLDLEITDRNSTSILTVPHLKVEISPSLPLENQIKIASVAVDSGKLSVVRDPKGQINLLALGPAPSPAEQAQQTEQSAPPENTTSKPFKLEVDDISLNGWSVSFTDQAALKSDNQPAQMQLDKIDINLKRFSLAPENQTSFSFKSMLNAQASISAQGKACISPLLVDAQFDVGEFGLQWIEPYIPKNILLKIEKGRFSTSGQAQIKKSAEGVISASVKAKASIDNFALNQAGRSEKFVSWDAFSLDDIDFALNPMKIDIGKISLNKFDNSIVLEKDGKLNVQKILAASEPSSEPQKKAKADQKDGEADKKTVPVTIGNIELKDFKVGFTDKKIEPNFSTRVDFSNANISGLATEGFKAAQVSIKGKIDNHAPIEVKGKVNPMGKDLFLDMTLDLSNLELSPMSPYTGKYIGKTIEKGKLNLDLKYLIDQKKIDGKNQILLDQFTLGQNVDSPDALNLPVGLAISLLKDRSGKINLDLPISGRTDDPEYKPGKLILQALENIITKAATSPFDLVASLIPGGEEVRFIEFAPGSASLNEGDQKKFDAIATLMFDRPGLRLDLAGFSDVEKDKAALVDMMFDRKIKEMKYAELSKKEKASISVEDVKLTPKEQEEYLKDLYKEDVLSNPDNAKTAKSLHDKTLTPEEMKSLIESQIQMDDNRLRDLAAQRTQQVKDNILKGGRVEESRIFIKEGGLLSPQNAGKHSASRVELSVQ